MPRKSSVDKRNEELLELKKLLIAERKRIVDHMKKIAKDSHSGISNIGGDDADIASIEYIQRTTARIGKREQKLLKKIDHALDKFGEGDDTGDYGICELTGEDIRIPRLKARPVAQFTIEAKEELERKEGGFREDDEDEEFSADED